MDLADFDTLSLGEEWSLSTDLLEARAEFLWILWQMFFWYPIYHAISIFLYLVSYYSIKYAYLCDWIGRETEWNHREWRKVNGMGYITPVVRFCEWIHTMWVWLLKCKIYKVIIKKQNSFPVTIPHLKLPASYIFSVALSISFSCPRIWDSRDPPLYLLES